MHNEQMYDIIVIGGGHAGIEAALAASRMNNKTLMVVGSINRIGNMPCNPSIGGPAKGIIVREIDALGGEMAKAAERYYGTGRRKKSVARVYVMPGKGKITINKRDIDEYFGLETLKVIVRQPLVATQTEGKYDIVVNVKGGGYTGQAGAIRHGLSRALLKVDEEFRPTLKKEGFLTRDPRMKERKKYGLKAARRAPQFSKR